MRLNVILLFPSSLKHFFPNRIPGHNSVFISCVLLSSTIRAIYPAYHNSRILLTLQCHVIRKPRMLCLGSYPFTFGFLRSKYIPLLKVYGDLILIQLFFWTLSSAQRAYEEGHKICLKEAKVLQIDPTPHTRNARNPPTCLLQTIRSVNPGWTSLPSGVSLSQQK
jgi:hypothetical protein